MKSTRDNKLTNVTGPIQPVLGWLAQMKTITFIDLSFNSLSGSIANELSQLPNLEELHHDMNKLTGRIPDLFRKFSKSPSMYLSHTQLFGLIPASMANYNTDVEIDLSRNRLEGNDASLLFGGNNIYSSCHRPLIVVSLLVLTPTPTRSSAAITVP
ncbi:Polygalacturonase inhibitor [Linum perenne]